MTKITLQGMAFDLKSSFMKGPAKAPPVIREHHRSESSNFFAENGLRIGPEIFEDKGDYNPDQYFDIESITLANLNNKLPLISLGGDHSVNYPIVKAFHAVHGPMEILEGFAHEDVSKWIWRGKMGNCKRRPSNRC